MRKKIRQEDKRLYVASFKELINEIVSQSDKEAAVKYIVTEVLPRVKEVFPPEEYQEIKAHAEKKLNVNLPDYEVGIDTSLRILPRCLQDKLLFESNAMYIWVLNTPDNANG